MGCSVNRCPLDPGCNHMPVHPDDKEKQCPMEKGVRTRIGSKYPDLLPLGGLTRIEAANATRWAKLSQSEKQAIADRVRGHRFSKPPETRQE